MTDILRPWPYAAKPYIQFEFKTDRLVMWLTFQYPMDISVQPTNSYFTTKVDGVDKTASNITWITPFTLKYQVLTVASHPARVLCTYDGPSPLLRTAWHKQWEPWERMLCTDVPYDFEHVLDIDIPNERVTINGVLALTSKTVTTGSWSELDVSDVNILFLDCSGGVVEIRTLKDGVNSQILHLARLCATANNITVIHNSGAAGQKIFLHRGASETLFAEYGGWVLVCNGTSWFDVSHAKHV